jgi:DNA-binding transcriptional LysR family regulator
VSLSQLDLNLLAVLRAVVEERSVVRAARRLHVTPSAVSNSLARLRHALGDPLVLKSGRGIVPTPRAAALAPVVDRALRDVERAIGGVTDPAVTTRRFTLAIADGGQIVQVPRLASELARAMPRAVLRVVGIDTLLSSGGLAGTEVDVAIAAIEDATPGVHLSPLYEERSVLVARRGHPLAGTSLAKRGLASLRHVDVHVAPGRGYRGLAAAYTKLGIARDVALVVPSFAAAAAVVAETDWVATLPESLVARFGKAFGIQPLASPAPRVSLMLKLAWHERIEHDPLMRAFRERVKSSVHAARYVATQRAPRARASAGR